MNIFRKLFGPKTLPDETTTEFEPFDRELYTIHGSLKDVGLFRSLQTTHKYETEVCRIIRSEVGERDIVLDDGANIGLITCVLAATAKAGTVFAFEPGKKASHFLTKTVRSNKFKNVFHVPLAVSGQSGTELSFAFSDDSLGGGHLAGKIENEMLRIEKVQTITIDDFVEKNRLKRIDFIKIDIEGAEVAALQGARRTLIGMRPKLVIECNSLGLAKSGPRELEEFYRILASAYAHIYIVPKDIYRNGLCVQVRSLDELKQSLSYGRGIDDLYCTTRPLPFGTYDFASYLACLKNTYGGRQLTLEARFSATLSQDSITCKPGARLSLPVRVYNLTGQTWNSFQYQPVTMAYHISDRNGQLLQYNGTRSFFPEEIGPGVSRDVSVTVDAPTQPGRYRVHISPVQEAYTWFDEVTDTFYGFDLEVSD